MSKIFCFLLLLFAGQQAHACSCVDEKMREDRKIARDYTRATLLIVGRVLKAEPLTVTDSVRLKAPSGRDTVYATSHQEVRYTLAVSKLLKGDAPGGTVTVRTAASSSVCGVEFVVGTEYLVYGYTVSQRSGPDGTLRPATPYYATSICQRTKKLQAVSSAELRQLRGIARKASGERSFEWSELGD